MSLRVGIVSVLAHLAVTARVKQTERAGDLQRDGQDASLHSDQIPCPLTASLVTAGYVPYDGLGRVTQNALLGAVLKTGATTTMAAFLAGAAGFSADDIHQNHLVRNSPDGNRVLNVFSLTPQSTCRKNGPDFLPSGAPCYANPEFHQHGFSTTLRDPKGGATATERFNNWFKRPGVLKRFFGLGRVMTIEGLGKLLQYASSEGDFSGQFSSNPDGSLSGSRIALYHPSITSSVNVSAARSWQAMSVFSMLWSAFAHESWLHYPAHIKESELKALFRDGSFPRGYQVKQWGLREVVATIVSLKGSGVGEEWITMMEGVLQKLGNDASEAEYMMGVMGALQSFGAMLDDFQYLYPPGRE